MESAQSVQDTAVQPRNHTLCFRHMDFVASKWQTYRVSGIAQTMHMNPFNSYLLSKYSLI